VCAAAPAPAVAAGGHRHAAARHAGAHAVEVPLHCAVCLHQQCESARAMLR
jgi:hypothetical protein